MKKLFEDDVTDRTFRHGQWRMLGLTIVGYTLFYFLRKNFSFAMPGLQQDLGVTKSMLGNCLMAGGFVYGISKFLNGVISDRVNPRRFFCLGLALCVAVNIAFGFLGYLKTDVMTLAQVSGGWHQPIYLIIALSAVGMILFMFLWTAKSDNYV